MSDSEIAQKKDDVTTAYDDKDLEGDKTRMGRIYQDIVIWRPLKPPPPKSRPFLEIPIEEGLDLVLVSFFVMR